MFNIGAGEVAHASRARTSSVGATGGVAASCAIGFVVLFLFTALSRMTFPFDLEWGEGLFVEHVARVVHGLPVYATPTFNFTALVYTPAYYYVAALPAWIFGATIATLRAVSITCAVALLGVLTVFGRREFGTVRDGITVAGLFAACYAIGGAWLDIARVDSLLLLLLFSAAYLIRFGTGISVLAASGVLLAAAVLTKQVALTLAPPLLLYAVCRHGWRGLTASGAFACALLLGVVVLEWRSRGWFLYYTFSVLSKSQSVWTANPGSFWSSDLLELFPLGTVLGLAWCALAWRKGTSKDWSFYPIVGLGMLASTWEARVHPGAWFNTLMPLFAFLSICTVAAAHALNSRLPGVGWLLVIAQFALLIYNPYRFIPDAADRRAADEVVSLIRRVPGDVLVLDHAYYATLAGKRGHVHEMAMRDVLGTKDEWADALRAQTRRAIEAEQFDVIIQDSPDWFPVPLGTHYRPADRLLSSDTLLKQRVGNPIRPAYVYLPKHRVVQWPPVDPAAGGER